MNSHSEHFYLKCVTCAAEYSPTRIDYTCPECGPLKGTLDVLYDYEEIGKKLTRSSLAHDGRTTLWRYQDTLPICSPEYIQALSVGWTPLYEAEKLGRQLGLKNLHIKDDSRNPTASFKDRASAVGVVKALEKGAKVVAAASTGNAASSWSAFTALAGLKTYIFVPENAPAGKLAQLLLYGAKVIQVKGTYDEAFDLCCQAAEKWGWYNRSTAVNPYLGEGKKTGAFEICEQLNWQVPDYVFVSVGDGCILQGTWKGFKEFHEIGLIERMPKLVGVQAEGSAPLVKAWQNGTDVCEAMEPKTVADSIAVGVPRDQVKALRAIRESGGQFVAVSDSEILAAIPALARQAGVFAEPAGATGFAGLRKLTEAGLLGSNATAVVIVTGHGLKDVNGVMKAVTSQPVKIDNNFGALEQMLKKVPAWRADSRA